MASEETVTYTCDREDDPVPATPHRLTLDGLAVDIDLCDDHLAVIAGYVLASRKMAGRKARSEWTAPGGGRSAAYRRRTRDIRLWAVEQGLLEPGSVGRLPGPVIAKYDAAHGGAR